MSQTYSSKKSPDSQRSILEKNKETGLIGSKLKIETIKTGNGKADAIETGVEKTGTIETGHPVYNTKILVVHSLRGDNGFNDGIKSKIAEITKILPVNIPRSIVAILFTLIIIPILFSPGIFMPDFLAAAGGVSISQFRFPEAVFKNLNFDSRDILEAQIKHLTASYSKRLVHYQPESEIARLIASRIQTAEYIWMNATDDLFFDYMMAQIANVKIKPYFGYTRNGKTPNRVSSLGRWADETERIDYERKLAKFMKKYPEIYEKANFDRLERINDLIIEAVLTHTYIIKEVETVIVKSKKAVKKSKKSHAKNKTRKSSKNKIKKAVNDAKPVEKIEKKASKTINETITPAAPEPVSTPEPIPASEPEIAPAPVQEAVPAPADPESSKKENKNKAGAKAKQDKKPARVSSGPAAPEPVSMPEPPAPVPVQVSEPPAESGDALPPAPEAMPEPPAPTDN